MIKITPYYDRADAERFQREYLRMIAAVTPFIPEDILYDDSEGLTVCTRVPKQRKRKKNGKDTDTAFMKLLKDYAVPDGLDRTGQLQAEAELAEEIVRCYSADLHDFLYDDSTSKGRVKPENLRRLLLLKLPEGKVPEEFRYDLKRSGSAEEWKKHAKALYEYVFPYDEFSKLKYTDGHRGIHELVAQLGVKVCPYCNRLFTTTVNTEIRQLRPQLDHFRNKNDYPFLALSINNLVPVCGVCNLLKLDKDSDLIYPYEEDFSDENHVFKTNIPAEHTVPALEGIPIDEKDFQILVERRELKKPENDPERCGRIQNSIQTLSLTELYQSHRDYVSFLYRQRYILTDQLAQDLYNQFPGIFPSAEALRQLFVLMNTDYGHWGDRPLAKLTHDILVEIDELYIREKGDSHCADDIEEKETDHSELYRV